MDYLNLTSLASLVSVANETLIPMTFRHKAILKDCAPKGMKARLEVLYSNEEPSQDKRSIPVLKLRFAATIYNLMLGTKPFAVCQYFKSLPFLEAD